MSAARAKGDGGVVRIGVLLGAALVLAGCGADDARGDTVGARGPVEHPELRELDRDGDGELGREEFFGATVDFYDELDMDQDGRLTPRELSDGLYRVWDLDQNGRLERGELERGSATWLPEDAQAPFPRWDEDENEWVDRAEFRRGIERSQVFGELDENGDGLVTDLELADGVFRLWDANADGSIDPSEWRWR